MNQRDHANQRYWNAYEALVELLMEMQDLGLGKTDGARSLIAGLKIMKEAFDSNDMERMNQICDQLRTILRIR